MGLFLSSSDTTTAQSILNVLTQAHQDVPIADSWGFDPEASLRSPVGYVGLRNMGCTCYMNRYSLSMCSFVMFSTHILYIVCSLLQILYMMPSIRRGVLETPIASSDPVVLKDNLAYQLQVMFQHLQHSTRKAFSPDGWVYSYKDESGNPINVVQQQDAQEFLQKLCERVEKDLLTPQDGTSQSTSRPLLQGAFGGVLCDQMINDSCEENSIRENAQDFVCVSLEVRGVGGLLPSLDKFVEGETISDFLWEEGKPRVNITKRQCISSLSGSVIFHLKRFELNFDTFLREKVNDEFTFPHTLDLYPYSREGLSGKPIQESEFPAGYYQYELGAIVVHTGTSDSGHYYSYIRESVEDAAERCRLLELSGQMLTPAQKERQWIEFNDSEVTPFSDLRIPAECFGGMTTSHDYIVSTQTWTSQKTPNPKSAYMLVYNRTSVGSCEVRVDEIIDDIPPLAVVEDNQTHILSHRVYSGPHMEYMHSVASTLLNPTQFAPTSAYTGMSPLDREGMVSTFKSNVMTFATLLSTHVARSLHNQVFQKGCEELVFVMDHLMTMGVKCPVVRPSTPPTPDLSQSDSVMSTTSAMETEDPEVDHDPQVLRNLIVDEYNAPLLAGEVASCVLSVLLINNGIAVEAILFSPEKRVRGAFCELLFKCFHIIYNSDPVALRNEIFSLPVAQIKANIMTPFSLNDIPQMVNGQETQDIASLTAGTNSPAVDLLLFLTRDSLFRMCADQWRRAESLMRFFSQIAPIDVAIRKLLVNRELVMQLVDLFVGDGSPCNGELYTYGSRKRAGTSYVSVVFDKNGKLPKSAEYIPDWMDLLSTLRSLVLSTFSNAMTRIGVIPPTLTVARSDAIMLDSYSHRCINCKILYTHALKQARYVDVICDIIEHASFDDVAWTNDVAEILVESISFAANDATGHYFRALERFLNIADRHVQHRAIVIFDGAGGLIQLLKNCMSNKPTFVCICIFSVFKLALRVPAVFQVLSTTQNKIADWAPSFLKFSFQFQERMKKEAMALEFENQVKATAPSADPNPPKKKGPFLVIFGESEPEREDTWVERGAKTFDLVQEVIRMMGGSPDALIPADTFDEFSGASADAAIVIADDSIPPLIDVGTGGGKNINGPMLPESALGDAMTDEEFARFLASTGGGADLD